MNTPAKLADTTPAIQMHNENLPPSLRMIFDDRLFQKCVDVANSMSKAKGFVPRHLIGQTEACFAVVVKALTWRMDYYFVASNTYQTPGGTVGFYGKLCQAVIEASGKIDGRLEFEYFGDWSKIQGKFKMLESNKEREDENGQKKKHKYPVPDWNAADEKGVGIRIKAKLKGEKDPLPPYELELVQAHPRNSTLWALDPKTQLQYLACRRFGDTRLPDVMAGAIFDAEDHYDNGYVIEGTATTVSEQKDEFLNKFEEKHTPTATAQTVPPGATVTPQPKAQAEVSAAKPKTEPETPPPADATPGAEVVYSWGKSSKKPGTIGFYIDQAKCIAIMLKDEFPQDRRALFEKHGGKELEQKLKDGGEGALVNRLNEIINSKI